jgi:hypothetical protein
LQMLKSDMGRTLAIDIETDSTVALEDEAEKAQRLEFLNYVSPFIQQVLPAMAQGMLPADVGKELLKFALQSFKHGRSLEDAIEAAPGTAQQMQQMQQTTQQAQQGMEQAQQQMQQLQQALQQCQEQLQQAQQAKIAGELRLEQDKIRVASQQLNVDKQQAMIHVGTEQQRLQQEMAVEREGLDEHGNTAETLAIIQQGVAMQTEAALQTMTQMQETLAAGLASIAASLPQQGPKSITVQRDKSGKIIGAISDGA